MSSVQHRESRVRETIVIMAVDYRQSLLVTRRIRSRPRPKQHAWVFHLPAQPPPAARPRRVCKCDSKRLSSVFQFHLFLDKLS